MTGQADSLYQRLGGRAGIGRIAEDVWGNHVANPDVSPRYARSDPAAIIARVTDFICAGTGGPGPYDGQSMRQAHEGMNISHREFMAVADDVLRALEKNHVGTNEQGELLLLLFSLRNEIIHR
ncbi:MAG: group I truncated hemoglobin [Acidiferrobacteraceae bacterium]